MKQLLKLIPLIALIFAATTFAMSKHGDLNNAQNDTQKNTRDTQKKRVLMVVSGYGQDKGEESPGYEFDEFSKAYLVFKHHGIEVDVSSPKGGKVEADKFDSESNYNARALADKAIMAKLENTLSTQTIDADQYDAVFIVGGKGAMFDLPKDKALQTLIADIYQQDGTVAAVCHGPAALVDVQLQDGSYLIAGKAVNGFTNKEEKLFGSKWINDFDFMLQDKLIERGGQFQASDIMLNHVAIDNRLITGQNPSSTVAVAAELVKSLGVEVKEMEAYRDDKTLALVAQIIDGDKKAVVSLKRDNSLLADEQQYNVHLVGMYGYFYLNAAKTDAELQKALTLMKLAQKAMNNHKLDMQIAKTQHKLGDNKAATKTLNQLLTSKPEYEPAQELLKSLTL